MELTAADLQEGPRAADGQEVSTAVEPTAAVEAVQVERLMVAKGGG